MTQIGTEDRSDEAIRTSAPYVPSARFIRSVTSKDDGILGFGIMKRIRDRIGL